MSPPPKHNFFGLVLLITPSKHLMVWVDGWMVGDKTHFKQFEMGVWGNDKDMYLINCII